jgi:hypothetical protein
MNHCSNFGELIKDSTGSPFDQPTLMYFLSECLARKKLFA